MNSSVYKISLDIHQPESQVFLDFKRLDSKRKIHISLVENGWAYQITPDCSAVFTAKKPDENPIYNGCSIDGNIITYDVTPQTTSCAGKVDCEIRLFNNDGALITSPRFTILVHDTVYNGEEIVESAPEADALQKLVDETNELYSKVNGAYENGEFKGDKGDTGPQGIQGLPGEKGEKGDKGEDGTGGIPIVTELPKTAVNGDLCLYSVPNILKTLDNDGRIVISIAELQELSTAGKNAYFGLILHKNGIEVLNVYLNVGDNGTSSFYYVDFVNEEDYYISFDNGTYDSDISNINGETVDLSAFPEAYPLHEYDSIVCEVEGDLPERYQYRCYLMEYDNGWKEVSSLLELSQKTHTHNNKKTLDLFSCTTVDTGFSQDASSDELKWQGKPIAFDFAGSKVSMVQEVEKNGKRYYRLWFTHGSFTITNVPDYIDIPIDTLNKVTEQSGNITLNGSELVFEKPDNSTEFEEIWQAINNINGGIDEIEALIDESGVLE